MDIVFYLGAAGAFYLGVNWLLEAKTTFHEIAALIVILIAAVLFSAGAILGALRAIRKAKDETPKDEQAE